ncbi:MAG TPA: hypothetical protein VLH59_06855 [Ignavibacteriaceae bacterium]|nr:hypothetical protein [Ignavibacteriaceae bacterium]
MKKILLVIFFITVTSFPQNNNLTLPQCVDVSISDVILRDTISSRLILGAENIIPNQDQPPFTFQFFNRQKTQLLTCEFCPGDYLYSLSEFKVHMNITDESKLNIDSLGSKIIVLENILSFKSGKNIEIGIDVSEVIKILGKPINIENEEGSDIFHYELKNPLDNPNEKPEPFTIEFLNSFRSHLYYGIYKFRNGKLIEFAFGFPMP